jgi:nucleoside-diphosphate-sugar epimerase
MLEHLTPAGTTTPRRVVIIGAAGFLGKTITRDLARAQIPTLGITRAEIDLLSPAAPGYLAKIVQDGDAVIMIAAKAPAKNPALVEANIRLGMGVCEGLGQRTLSYFIYISSDAVYDDDARPVTEQSARAPSTLHGAMHHTRELMFDAAINAPRFTLRPTLIYGPGDPHNGYGPNRFAREALAGGPVCYFGEGEEKRDHIFVEDVAALTRLAIRHQTTGVLNAVTGVSIRFRDLAEALAGMAGVDAKSIPRPAPRGHLLHRHFDTTLIRNAFPTFRFTPVTHSLARLLGRS